MAALPAIPLGAAGDTQAKSEYLDALNRVSQAIDAQSEQKFPWFEMAGAFLNPGQSGSFGEGLGRAAGVMGQYPTKTAGQCSAFGADENGTGRSKI